MKAEDIKSALVLRHSAREGEWVCVEEAFSGFTSRSGGVDLLAIGAWQTAKAPGLPGSGKRPRYSRKDSPANATYPMVAYEVKVSRSDFRRELVGYKPGPKTKWKTKAVPPWPVKQRDALAQTHFFMFATPKGLLKEEEINRRSSPDGKGLWVPKEAGLIEIDEKGRCKVRVEAPRRDCPPPLPRGQIAELIRHALKPLRTTT